MASSPVEVANLAKEEKETVDPVTREREENAEFDRFPEKPVVKKEETPAAATSPVQEKPKETPVEAKKPNHSAYAVRRALRYGATQAEIDSVDEAYLEAWLSARDDEAEAAVAKPTEKPPVEPEDEIDVMAKEFQWDARFVKLQKDLRDKNKALEAEIAKHAEKEKKRDAIEAAQTFDAAFEELGEEFAEIFGEGSGLDMKGDDPFREARVAVIRAANYDQSKDAPSQIKSKIKAAAKKLYGKFAKKPAPVEPPDPYAEAQAAAKNGHITKEKWKEAGAAVPTQTNVKPKKGREAALASARDWYIAHPNNIPDDDSDMDFE